MLNQLLQVDAQLTNLLKNFIPHTKSLDEVFSFLSLRGNYKAVWVVLMIFFAFHLHQKAKKFILDLVLIVLSILVFVNVVLKNIFHRARPISHFFCSNDYSLPSGHAAGAFAAAYIFSHFDRERAWLYYIIAVSISFSRIYLGCHYLLDVVIGAAVGYFVTKALLKTKFV